MVTAVFTAGTKKRNDLRTDRQRAAGKKKDAYSRRLSDLCVLNLALAFLGTQRLHIRIIRCRDPVFSPGRYLAQRFLELMALFGELVLHSNRTLGNDCAQKKALGFERAESFRQHSVGYLRYGSLDGRVAALSLKKSLQNSARPPTTDELDRLMEAGADR
jgi:hypothetical protein